MARQPLAGNDDSWRDQARCVGTDPDVFFPLADTGANPAQAEVAKRMCQTCGVREPCLQFALQTNQVTGVWGGTTEDERRSLRRRWVRAGRPSKG